MTARKLLVRVTVVMLCVTASAAIAVLLGGRFDDTTDRILLTTTAVSLFGLLAVPATTLTEGQRALVLARTSIAADGAALALTLVVTWTQSPATVTWQAWGVLVALARTTFRLELDGRAVEQHGRDFAAAVASAIREAERSGGPGSPHRAARLMDSAPFVA